MTLQELQQEIKRWSSLSVCDDFLKTHLYEIRPLFYGLTSAELRAGRIDYEDTLLIFVNSRAGQAIRDGAEPPASVIALLIFFLSLFQRAELYAKIRTIADFLPIGSLRTRAEAIFEYKNITNSRKDYLDRFERIVSLIHDAWENGLEVQQKQCEDLLVEYALDALIYPKVAGIDLRTSITTYFLNPTAKRQYPILKSGNLRKIFDLDNNEELLREHNTVRSRIVESLHSEACDLVPGLFVSPIAETDGTKTAVTHEHKQLPSFIDDQLERMGAVYQKKKQGARFNFEATHQDNQIYLGTYFPRTVIEAWNILSELFSIPAIGSALRQKDTIRILDIGSGTGAAVAGTLLALSNWGGCEAPIEITAVDTNQDALCKQGDILESFRDFINLDYTLACHCVNLPVDLESYVPALSAIADQFGTQYDIITSWKCLCEFYNVNYASAQGIISNTLRIASRLLLPYGLCIIADVTTRDNPYEYFPMILNREANQHDQAPQTKMRTILPIPCARVSATCHDGCCFTQRRFVLNHRLVRNDETKIAYRVFAPHSFAETITANFTEHLAYRVNAARPNESCFSGRIGEGKRSDPCGFTGFFTERK
ncbi:MAG: hypothetical protein GX147_10765 [Deltaproteobacteria bacterium]|jgi:SAM-dependent methyltransferase|nr:hypothetical protein [Deltaproteobacteria bacterium]